MKDIALRDKHIELGAKMVPFAGYNMPLQYSGLSDEHLAVRNAVGVFDVSHMGEFFVEGEQAADLVQKLTSNNVAALEDGKVQYSCFPNGSGGIVDDLLVYRISSTKFMLVVNASNMDKDWEWVTKFTSDFNCEVTNPSDDISLLAVQGPRATEAMKSLTDMNLQDMVYYTFQEGKFAGVDDVLISTTGYTGAGGFEIYFRNEHAEMIWDAVIKAGEPYGMKAAGLGARDTLRLEMGFCLYGNDIDDTTSPLEAGLGWITKFVDGNDFVDRERLQNQKAAGLTKRLVAFEMVDKGIPRQGYEILNEEGENIGRVTSGTMSPSLKKAIGLGYVTIDYKGLGSDLYIAVRKKKLKATVVKLPFYKG